MTRFFNLILIASSLLAQGGLASAGELDPLKAQLFKIIRDEEATGRCHGTSFGGLAQMLPSSHCDKWVDAVRAPLTRLKLEPGQQARIYPVVTNWNGPGGRHDLYFGFVKKGGRLTWFVFDPWQHRPEKQFMILQPNPTSGLLKFGSAQIAYDPVTQNLFYEKAPNDIPECDKKPGDTIGAQEDPIDLLGPGSQPFANISPNDAICLNSRSMRIFLGEENFAARQKNCAKKALRVAECPGDCANQRQHGHAPIGNSRDLEKFYGQIQKKISPNSDPKN